MQPIPKLSAHLAGRTPLPAGAVPLATDAPASLVCLMPNGRWIRWWPADRLIEAMPSDTQRAVLAVLVDQLGGTAAMAERLDVSPRTVEGWRANQSALPIRTAYTIAQSLPTNPKP